MPFPITSPSYLSRPGATAESLPRDLASGSFTPTSGTLHMRAMPVQYANFNNGVMKVAATAKLGGSHGWYVVCDNTGAVLLVTADQVDPATTWGTINQEQALPFIGNYQSYYNSVRPCYFGVCIVATTMPTLLAASGGVFTSNNSEPPFVAVNGGSGLTTPPVVGSVINLGIANNNNLYCYTT